METFKASDNITLKEQEKEHYLFIIDGVIKAESASDLKKLVDSVYSVKWKDSGREMFLLGLLQGAVMQYNKKASIEELETIFKKH